MLRHFPIREVPRRLSRLGMTPFRALTVLYQEETVTNEPGSCPVATALWAVNERGLPRWDRPQAGGYNPLVGLRSKTSLNRYEFGNEEMEGHAPACPGRAEAQKHVPPIAHFARGWLLLLVLDLVGLRERERRTRTTLPARRGEAVHSKERRFSITSTCLVPAVWKPPLLGDGSLPLWLFLTP